MNEAQTEAIAQADAELSNAALPTYSELLDALNRIEARVNFGPSFRMGTDVNSLARTVLSRIPT